MKILVIGSGGREHALAHKLAGESGICEVIVTPGNAGMSRSPNLRCEAISASDSEGLLALCERERPGLVVIGPEGPLAAGLADTLNAQKFKVFGPSAAATRLESSKIFAKQLMCERGIPTARFQSYANCQDALKGLERWDVEKGIAIKMDALAAGKGVRMVRNRQDARQALKDFKQSVVIEEELHGFEASAFFLCDGFEFRCLGLACDYKRLLDEGAGPNTGGMGVVAPHHALRDAIPEGVEGLGEKIVAPVLTEMRRQGHPFSGVLFVGLMVTPDGSRVLEFNVRFGDPETQALLPLLAVDLHPWLLACAQGGLSQLPRGPLPLKEGVAVHVVLASGGYANTEGAPLSLNHPITYCGDHWPRNVQTPNVCHFFAGVKAEGNALINCGGRVLGVTALGNNLEQARALTYAQVEKIHFEGVQWRKDIGK